MRLSALFAFALLCTACDLREELLPDGGRARVNCDNNKVKVPVTLLDKSGAKFPKALLVAQYPDATSETLIANAEGVVTVTDHGPGTVQIQGNYNGFVTDSAELNFNGGECATFASPTQLTLQFR
jgi:hypothetical protein